MNPPTVLDDPSPERRGIPGPVRLLAAVAIFLCCGCASAPKGLPDPSGLAANGERSLNEGRADEARALFYEAMRGEERPFLAWIGVARASIALGDLETAEAAMSQALRYDFGSGASADLLGRTALMLAQALGRKGRGQALVAASMFNRARRLDPSLPRLTYHQGLAHLVAAQPEIAEPMLERAWEEAPGSADVLHALVLSWRLLKSPGTARTVLDDLAARGELPAGFESDLAWAHSAAPDSRGAASRRSP